jgi:signal transduction histidine kinase/ActR/RegA family two-component response regulator
MMAPPTEFVVEYRRAVQDYVRHGRGEAALLQAYDAGREAVSQGLSLLDLVTIHHQAMLTSVLGPFLEHEALRLATMGEEFLRESLAPYELVHRGFSEANSRLRDLNANLEQKVYERTEELAATARRLQTLNDFARLVSGTLDLQSLLGSIVRQVANLTACEWCSVAEFRPDESQFRVIVEWRHPVADGLPALISGDVGSAASATVLDLREPHICQDTRQSRLPAMLALAEAGVGTLISLPILAGGNLWGALNVGFGGPFEATTDRLEFLTAISTHLAIGIRNAELYNRLQAAYQELQQTQQQIVQQERLRALGAMASGIAHDFNNALAPIVGFTELLLSRPNELADRDTVTRYLELIREGADDAASVVSRLRDFYRPRSDDEVMLPVNLTRVVEQAVSLTQPRWRDQLLALGRTVHVELDTEPVPDTAGNEAELREALTNLIFNAVDALPHGGIVTLSTRLEGDRIVLQVRDTGVGMDEETRRRCMEPFFTTKGTNGTGLGLAMVYGIVKRHQGAVEIDSTPGHGTTFNVRFPLTQAWLTPTPSAAPVQTPSLRILVVDDEPHIREYVTEGLKQDGHQVEGAENGQTALEIFTAHPFDLVITDRAMPELNGDQLAAAIKAQSPTTPVILLTGFGDLMEAVGDVPTGVDSVVSKPVRLADLWRAVAQVATRRAA